MRIATWNLQRATVNTSRTRKILDWIKEVQADIWILTETDERISPGSDYLPIHTDRAEQTQRETEKWVVIWSRFPHVELLPSTDSSRTAIALIDTPQYGSVIVCGTVFPWFGDRSKLPLTGADAFCSAVDLLAMDLSQLRAKFAGAKFCLAGDFNQDLNNHHFYGSKKGKAKLKDMLETAGLTCLTCGELDPVFKLTKGIHACIDHICVNKEWVTCKSGAQVFPAQENVVPGKDRLSDHFGVFIDL